MYFTTFNPGLPFFHDPVYFLRDPGNYLDDVSSWPDHLGTLGAKSSAYWPNFPIKVPKEVLGYEGVIQTSGFLVPGKTAGKIELFDTSAAEQGVNHPIDIAHGAREGHDWSYHWVVWKDIDNDGLIDALTARFRVPTFGDPISQLIFLKNPGVESMPSPGHNWDWQHFIITEGPDVYFELEEFSGCGSTTCFNYSAIVLAELWTEWVSALRLTGQTSTMTVCWRSWLAATTPGREMRPGTCLCMSKTWRTLITPPGSRGGP